MSTSRTPDLVIGGITIITSNPEAVETYRSSGYEVVIAPPRVDPEAQRREDRDLFALYHDPIAITPPQITERPIPDPEDPNRHTGEE
jgi:hypothetical protein